MTLPRNAASSNVSVWESRIWKADVLVPERGISKAVGLGGGTEKGRTYARILCSTSTILLLLELPLHLWNETSRQTKCETWFRWTAQEIDLCVNSRAQGRHNFSSRGGGLGGGWGGGRWTIPLLPTFKSLNWDWAEKWRFVNSNTTALHTRKWPQNYFHIYISYVLPITTQFTFVWNWGCIIWPRHEE